ncbi:MAG: hypothetical protein PWP52_1021 [Bacteroidales bacterium]|nr:hypothetical protein [Bacteroidales bacterium]
MKNLKNFYFVFLFIQIPFFTLGQNIYEKAAQQNNNRQTEYTKYSIASSNAYAYKHNDYTPKLIEKLVYFINTEDEKIKSIIEKEFEEVGIEAIDFFDLNCENCDSGEKVKKFLHDKGYKTILQVTLSGERKAGSTLVSNYYKTAIGYVGFSNFTKWTNVFTVFEWYDDQFSEEPFLKSEVLKMSSQQFGAKRVFYKLVKGNIILLIRRPIKYDLLIENKRKRR